jgi:hypothetical protein
MLLSSALIACLCGIALPADKEEPSPEPPGRRITAGNLTRLREMPSIDRDVWRIVWRPDRKQVAFAYWEGPVEIRDPKEFRVLHQIGVGRKVIAFAFSSDPDVVAFCENGTPAEVLHLRKKQTFRLDTGKDQVSLAFSPKGKLLATGGYNDGAKLWDPATGKLLRSLNVGTVKGGLTVVFSPDGKMLAVGNRNSTTRLFEVATGNLLHTLNGNMSHELRFHPNGKTLAVAYVDGSVRLWDVASGALLRNANSRAREVYTLDWSPRGDVLVSAGRQGSITLWDPKNLAVLKELKAPDWVIRVRFTPDGTRLLAAGGGIQRGGDRKVRVWGVR